MASLQGPADAQKQSGRKELLPIAGSLFNPDTFDRQPRPPCSGQHGFTVFTVFTARLRVSAPSRS